MEEIKFWHNNNFLKCRYCTWFVLKDEKTGLGHCRKHAPAPMFPFIFADDWCGDIRLDPSKINPEDIK